MLIIDVPKMRQSHSDTHHYLVNTEDYTCILRKGINPRLESLTTRLYLHTLKPYFRNSVGVLPNSLEKVRAK